MSATLRNFSLSGLVNFGVIVTTIMIYIGAAQAFSALKTVKSQTNADEKLISELNTVSGITIVAAFLLTMKVGYDAMYKR